jgi:integrase
MENTAHCALLKKYKDKDEKYNVKLCIYLNGERHYLKTKFDVTENEWKKVHSKKLKDKKFIEVRDSIEEIETTARKVLKKNENLTFDQFEESYYNELHKIRKDNDVFHWFDEYQKYLIEKNRPVSYSDHIVTSKNSLKEFKSKITFSQLTTDFLEKYRDSMKSKVESPTVESYLRDLRTVYNYTIKKHGVSKDRYPFGQGGFTIGSTVSRKKSLSKPQLLSLRELKLTRGEKKEWGRDIFVFQYFTNGLNMIDLCKLKEKNIERTEKVTFLSFERTKTQRTKEHSVKIRVVLTPEALDVIDKWGNKNREADDYIFPYFNELKSMTEKEQNVMERKIVGYITRNLNRQLKHIGEKLELPFILTSGISRHTFATTLKTQGYSPTIIGESMGHTNTRTTEIYLDSIGDEQIKEISKSLY